MNKFYKIKYVSNWHSYWSLNGTTVKNGDDLDLLLGQVIYKTKAVIELKKYQGKGGMDESYSWEELSCEIKEGALIEIKLKEGMKMRFR